MTPKEQVKVDTQAEEVTVSKPPNRFAKICDGFELWLVQTGYLDILGTFVTSSTTVRTFLTGLAGSAVTHGIFNKAPTEIVISGLAFGLVWATNTFITHVRNKYSKIAQEAIGMPPDKFFGPESADALKKVLDLPDTDAKVIDK